MNNQKAILKTLEQKNISLVLFNSDCVKWDNKNNAILISNKENFKKELCYKLKYPLKDSAKQYNHLENKTIKKDYSTFKIIKKAITRFKDYDLKLIGNRLNISNSYNYLTIDKNISVVV